MTEVSRSKRFDMTADELWSRIGDFHGAHTWHPAVASSESSNGGLTRTLTLVDDAQIVETLTGEGERSYSYRIDESPLPLAEYEATISAHSVDGGSELRWAGSFEPAGASEEEAAAIVANIYDTGIAAL